MARQPHLKCTMSGIMKNSANAEVEAFAISLSYGQSTNSNPDLAVTWTQDQLNGFTSAQVSDPITQWWAGSGSFIAAACELTQIKFASLIPGVSSKGVPNFKYLGDPVIFTVAVPGGDNVNPVHPSTTSYAVSLRTQIRGAKGRGRFFVPGVAMGITTDWVFNSAQVQTAANAALVMIDSLGTGLESSINPGGTGQEGVLPIVASAIAGNNSVSHVEVGTVPDNISRRKRQLVEHYAVGTMS